MIMTNALGVCRRYLADLYRQNWDTNWQMGLKRQGRRAL